MGDKEFNVAARAASSVLGATAAAAAPGLLGATTASPAPGVEAAGHAMIRAQERQLCTNRLFRTPGVFPRHQIIRVGTNERLFRGLSLRRDLGSTKGRVSGASGASWELERLRCSGAWMRPRRGISKTARGRAAALPAAAPVTLLRKEHHNPYLHPYTPARPYH